MCVWYMCVCVCVVCVYACLCVCISMQDSVYAIDCVIVCIITHVAMSTMFKLHVFMSLVVFNVHTYMYTHVCTVYRIPSLLLQ